MRKIKDQAPIAYSVTHPVEVPFWNEIVCGDSADLLKSIPTNSVDLVITSPPYFQQREYDGGGVGNEKKPDDYISALMKIFSECVRAIKPTGSIVFNVGDKYEDSSLLLMPYRFAIAATEQCGVTLVNNVTWVKSNPTPRQFKRRLVSSTEPFFHFVKSQDYKYFLDEFLKPVEEPKTNGNGNGNGAGENVGKKYFLLIEQSMLTQKQKEMAKNGLEEVIEEVRNGEIQGFRMKIRGIHSEPFGGQEGGRKIQLDKNGFTIIRIYGNPLKKDVITTPVESLKNCPHPAIYPVKIVDEFIKLLTQKGDIVLDPFVGSGSTAVAAFQNERAYIGFDISEEYCLFAQKRLSSVKHQLSLWERSNVANAY
ncbi:MAG: site-specific DNA-methyltransferase [Anaerolineae bacterium CG1_02_58_13]|nr:MAG: site-specific DNA-methyltransferase [Anaerolineae bacterium CG1_02_58_13]